MRSFVDAQPNPAEVEAMVTAGHPLGRRATPEEIAAAIVSLASDSATFVTGTIFTIDGGFTAQ